MPNPKFHARLQSLFADIEHLAAQPDADGLDVRRELEALRLRVLELEAQFSESEKPTSTPESVPPAEPKTPAIANVAEVSSKRSILYEKEQVGYAYAGDKLEPLQISTLTGLDIQHAIQI